MKKEQTPICKCGNKASYTYESLSKPKLVSLCESCNETRAENLIKGHNYVLKMERTADELLDHYCSYNGIQDENKEELISIVKAKVLEALEKEVLKAYKEGWEDSIIEEMNMKSPITRGNKVQTPEEYYKTEVEPRYKD